MATDQPLEILGRWLVEAEDAGVPAPRAMTLATATAAGRPRGHQLQAHVSRQGEEIAGLDELRERLEVLEAELGNGPVPCPDDWGAVRVVPDRIEFWQEDPDRLHERLLFEAGDGNWRRSLLAP